MMTYSADTGKYKIFLSDSRYNWCRKKPTISVYDKEKNIETKVASFNNQESFEWLVKVVMEGGE